MIPVTQPTQNPDDPFAQYGGQVDTTYGSPTSSTSSEGAGGLSGTAQGTNTFQGGQFPGDPNLPGYGDMTTSNPWRDSLTYQQIMSMGGGQSINSAIQNQGGGVNTGVPVSTTGGAAPAGGGDQEAAFGNAWKSSGGKTVADLQAFVKAHPEYGVTLFGSKGDKIQFANGNQYDGVLSAGAGGLGATFDRIGGGGSQFGGGNLGSLGYGFGDSMKPYGGQFNLPTLDEFKASPMYGAGLDAFNRANQNSAAARGTLLNGQTNEAMAKSALDYGLTQYGSLANLNAGAFNTNYGIFKDNQDRPFDKNVTLAKLGAPQ